MSERNMSIVFSSGVSNLIERNSSFDGGVLRVAYTGKNRNNSFISKETFERCMPSIYNCPIVCNYDRETDTIGSHDMELVSDDKGLRIVNITQPVGVIPESANYWWEEIEDDLGIHEYLCVDALIWKRQEAYQKIKENVVTDESMEISVKEGQMIDGVFVIDRFEFTAFCLLESARPCYESASLEVFACDEFKQQLALMMREFKENFNMVQPSHEVGIHTQITLEGGKNALEEKNALMAEFGLTADMLDFNIEEFSVEELRARFEEMNAAEAAPASEDNNESFALEREFRTELINVLEQETIETCWGPESHYWFWDYDRELSEVYANDACDFNIYGFTYSMDGDRVIIDFTSKKRMKLALAPFDEGSQGSPMTAIFERVAKKYATNNKRWEEKYQEASSEISSLGDEIASLREFKENADAAVARAERDEILARFEDLVGNEAFESLREHSLEYPLEALEEKCYAIRGRNGVISKFSFEPKAPKLPVQRIEPSKEPYGGAFAEYGFSLPIQHN